MYSKAVEESLHPNRPPRSLSRGTVEIKGHLRLAEVWREQVPRLGTIDAAAGIGHQLALAIVDRKHDPMAEESRTGIVADPKPGRRGRVHRALAHVRRP